MATQGVPWLDGIDFGNDDTTSAYRFRTKPIEPVTEDDVRPSVMDLVSEYRTSIDEMQDGLKSDLNGDIEQLYNPLVHDDLWLLRYLLSHRGQVPKALEAAKSTMEFRHKYQLDRRDIRFTPIQTLTPEKAYPVSSKASIFNFLGFCAPETFVAHLPDTRRGTALYVKLAGVDMHGLVSGCTEEDLLLGALYPLEWNYQWLDRVTRETGRLTKFVRVADIKGLSSSSINRECARINGKISQMLQDMYPQMLDKFFVVNSPSFVKYVWKMLKAVVPSRVASKIDFVPSVVKEKIFGPYFSLENLPERYGGSFSGWPPLTPEKQSQPFSSPSEETERPGVNGVDKNNDGEEKDVKEDDLLETGA